MQKHFITFLALLVSGAAWAQQTCPRPVTNLPFQGNQVRYELRAGDGIKYNCVGGAPQFRADTALPNISSLFTSQLWLATIDGNGTQYLAANDDYCVLWRVF